MIKLNQKKTPLFDAVKNHVDKHIIPFHVPGHKHGKGLEEFTGYVGQNVMLMDLNSMDDLDNACNPIGAIMEAERLCANAFGADEAYFLVNGTTAGVQAMILSSCQPGDQILIPRNAHKSTIGGIILSGAVPVYMHPEINDEFGIAMAISEQTVKSALKTHPHAKAIFVINPTYYGVSPDIKTITRLSHRYETLVLVDEAHGAHMCFHDDFPLTAMEVGADMSAASLHKTSGSMTQTSVLLSRGNLLSKETIRQVINLTYTTSASYVLMSSIDVARKQLAVHGVKMLEKTLEIARYARSEINKIDGLLSFGQELIGTPGVYDFDETKLTVNVRNLGYTGYEVEKKLREEYNIQIELADLYNVLAVITIGDTFSDILAFINALKDISLKAAIKEKAPLPLTPPAPKLIVSPRDAFYSNKKSIPLENAAGEIAAEMIMAYPPGIPIICPGERFDRDIIEYIKILKSEYCQLQGTADPYVDNVMILGTE